MKKRLLSMILALSMMLTILPVNAITALAANDGMSGNCGKTGDNVTYVLTQNNDDTTNPTYTLTIQGNGEMADFKESDMEGRAPWIADKEKITAVTIENGVTYVGAYAFDHCKKLTQITIHAQLDSIGEGAFRDCEGLTSIEIPKTVTSIGASAFSRCKGLSNIEIPETVVSIGGAAFNGCTGLTSIKIPAAVTSIKEYTFNECSNLKNVEIPQGVVSIGECAFSGCGILESIKIPQNVTSIGEYAFFGCKTITSIKIPAKVTSISKGILSGCSNLKDVEILGAVTSIGDSAFMSCGKLTDIKIPDTVTSIGKNAFYMSGLTSIKIPNTVTSIGEYAFYVCNSLAKIEMPANMPSILQYTFYRTTTTVDETRVFYYPGYRHNWDQQVSKISVNGNTDLLANDYERVHYYCDVIFDSNGGTFTDVTDGSNTKTIKEVWRKEHLTQEQINSVGKPTKDGKMFIGWNTTRDATTVIDPKSDYIADDKIYYAVYKDAVPATVTISGPTDNTVKAGEGSNVFTVAADKGTGAVKAKFDFAGGKVQYRTGDTEEWLDLTSNELNIDDLTGKQFRVVPDADAATAQKTLTVKLVDASGNDIDIAGATASTTFAVTARKPAEVTITGLDNTTVKAGEAKDFTVSVTPNDDANTGAKATITVSGANAAAVEKIQYKDGGTWKDVPGEGLSIDAINNTEFKLITKAGANDGDVTITVTAKKADGTEIDKKVAAVTVKKHENAAVTIDGLSGTVETDTEKEFTVTVTANDDAGKNVTAKAGFTGPAGAAITLKKVQYRFGDSGEWQDGMQELNGMNLDINSLELPFNSLPNITYKLTVTFAEAGNYKFDVSLTKKDAAEAFTSDSAEVTVTKKEEPVTPGGSTGGGENPGENPGSGSTGGSGNTGDKDPETKSYELTVIGGSFTAKQGENALDVETAGENNTLTAKIPAGAVVTVTLNKAAVPEGMNFDQWRINDDTLMGNPDVAYNRESFHFTMPDHDVKVEVMYKDATIESDGPGILGTGALIATGVVGSAALLYQGHMLGTELYLRYLLPHGAVIPQNRAELALLVWNHAGKPAPAAVLPADATDTQKAVAWAVENDLLKAAKDNGETYVDTDSVSRVEVIRVWNKAQEK